MTVELDLNDPEGYCRRCNAPPAPPLSDGCTKPNGRGCGGLCRDCYDGPCDDCQERA